MTVQFFNFYDLFSQLSKYALHSKLDNMLRSLVKTDLLIIDEFAFKNVDQKYAEYIYAVIDQRYSLKSTIITSNRSISDWSNIFPDPIMANALMDRLCHNAHQIIIKDESYRKKMKPKMESA